MPAVIAPETAPTTEILEAMQQGVTAVTANKRLALSLHREYDRWMASQGRDAWPTPDILPWNAWLERMLENARLQGSLDPDLQLLAPTQERYLWEEIVLADLSDQPLLQPQGAIDQGLDAWRLLHAWELPLKRSDFAFNKDSASFFTWASAYDARCRKHGWLSPARLAWHLAAAISDKSIPLPRSLLILGFDELPPQQSRLLDTLQGAGCRVRVLQRSAVEAEARRIGCADSRVEHETLARWLRGLLERRPDTTIGVIVPDLAARRASLGAQLDEVLAPGTQVPGQWSTPRPYNISLGLPLSHEPLIAAALLILRLPRGETIALEDAGRLLLSPFLAGWREETGARALLDACLRTAGEGRIHLGELLRLARQSGHPYACPILVHHVGQWRDLARGLPRRAGSEDWAAHFTRLLRALGWAAGRTLSSEEYQTIDAWRELLIEFSAMRRVSGPLSQSAAIALLEQLATNRIFQPQGPTAPVQVLGLLEAAGLAFDHLWIMGLHDGQWPPAPHPNPFLPLPMQRRAGLPHASEAQEIERARAITRRLLGAAPEVTVSYPLRSDDAPLNPSPLIADLPEIQPQALPLSGLKTWRAAVLERAELEDLTTDPAPPLAQTSVAGGSSVFKLQAACPFRAFAELRLAARPLEEAAIGLDPRARGQTVHRILEQIWRRLESHARLLELDPPALEALIADCVNQALDELARRYPHTLKPHFLALESERLCRNMQDWLALERQRQPFRVAEREARRTVAAGGIEVQLTIDRIDELPDGRKVLFDYKTGKLAPAQWFGERPEEPQLPVYSMAISGELGAVLFGQVRTRAMAFRGIAAESGLIPTVPSWEEAIPTRHAGNWENVLGAWRNAITRLGESFRSGRAEVDPKRFPGTCRHCALTPLCRVHESPAGRRPPENENGGGDE
jgi:probable DNA repair protein